MEPVMPENNFFSLKSFADLVYQDYIRGPLLVSRPSPITENRKENHARILAFWKERDQEIYTKALEILTLIQDLAEDPEEARRFEEYRKADGKTLSVLEALSLPEEPQQEETDKLEDKKTPIPKEDHLSAAIEGGGQGEQVKATPVAQQAAEIPVQKPIHVLHSVEQTEGNLEKAAEQSTDAQDFSQLEDEGLIGNRQLDSLTLTLLQQKYGEKIKVIEGKGEYYLNEPSEQLESLVNDLGERIVIHYKGKLSYYDPFGVREYISCYEIIKEKMGQSTVTEVFSNIRTAELNNPEYARAVAEFLLSDENLSLHNYGGYIGEIEKASIVQKNATPIPPEPIPGWNVPRQPKYCIYYDPMALTAAKLLEKQKEKDEKRPADGLGEFEPDASGR